MAQGGRHGAELTAKVALEAIEGRSRGSRAEGELEAGLYTTTEIHVGRRTRGGTTRINTIGIL